MVCPHTFYGLIDTIYKEEPTLKTVMETLITSALLLVIAPPIAQTSPPQPEPIPIEVRPSQPAQPEAELAQPIATCPPGQFPSAFSDVYPTDWAYQAVNRIASRPIECFDLPTNEPS